MRPAPTILVVLLTLLMTLTGIGAASARGAMAADGVICGSGTHAVVIAHDGLPLFDAGGAPVEATALPCLDCVFAWAMAPEGPLADTGLRIPSMLEESPFVTPVSRLWRMGGMGRSPPVPV